MKFLIRVLTAAHTQRTGFVGFVDKFNSSDDVWGKKKVYDQNSISVFAFINFT